MSDERGIVNGEHAGNYGLTWKGNKSEFVIHLNTTG